MKLLPVKNDRDIAVFGIVGVNAPRDSVVARILEIERFIATRNPSRYQVFGNPPGAADVRTVAFDDSEYKDLRNCGRGNCDFKLPASAMDVFKQQVNWTARDAKVQADQLLRTGLLQLATDYAARGNAAMLVFDDVRGVRASDVFADLLQQSPDLYEYAPELQRYLASYPAARPAGARDFLYWTEDRMPKMRPTLAFNHLVVYTPPSVSQITLVARKQIHASHYFEGAFELLAVIDATTAPNSPGTYLLTVRRYRFDNLPGGLLNIRGKVQQQLQEVARSELERQRATLQARGR